MESRKRIPVRMGFWESVSRYYLRFIFAEVLIWGALYLLGTGMLLKDAGQMFGGKTLTLSPAEVRDMEEVLKGFLLCSGICSAVYAGLFFVNGQASAREWGSYFVSAGIWIALCVSGHPFMSLYYGGGTAVIIRCICSVRRYFKDEVLYDGEKVVRYVSLPMQGKKEMEKDGKAQECRKPEWGKTDRRYGGKAPNIPKDTAGCPSYAGEDEKRPGASERVPGCEFPQPDSGDRCL